MVQRVGDEFMHFTTDADGRLLTAKDGAYYFARLTDNGVIESTGILATQTAGLTNAQLLKDIDLKGLRAKRNAAGGPRRAIAQTGMGRFSGNFPRTGKVRGLVILVQYKDVKFTMSDPKSYFEDLLMEEGFSQYGGTGSAHDYFLENSNGQFDPQFDVYGPFTLSKDRSYYGGNDAYWGQDENPEMMIYEACQGLDGEINFADYDMDNDGYVDNVFVFYAGQGEADYGEADCVWPHQWELSSAGRNLTCDGKKIDKYACTNEWEQSTPCGIGTFVHEFSHVMGLPDLYNTEDEDGSDWSTPGEWSVLDYGPYNNDGRTPPAYSLFERNAMGWCEPKVLTNPEMITLENVLKSNEGCLIQTQTPTEFFLLENRQQSGWDEYLPGHGLVIWHIDFVQSVWDNNSVNNNKSHRYVRIVPANNNVDKNDGWSWPGTTGKTSFTSTTTPALKDWNNRSIDVPVTDISEKNGIVTFAVMGGVELIPAPTANPATKVEGGFLASWNAVEGAEDYLLTVTAIEKGTGTSTEYYDGKTLPEGWEKSFSDTYTSTESSGESAPSLKFSKSGHQLETRKFDSDVTALSFWYRGNSTSGSKMTVSGLVGSSWTELAVLSPADRESGTYEIKEMPAGVSQIRFVYTKDKGNMAIDDVRVTFGGDKEVALEGYTDLSTGGETSWRVEVAGLPYTIYNYYVKSTDGEVVSRSSNVVTVDIDNLTGVEEITDEESPVEYYTLQGIRVENPVSGKVYIRRQGSRSAKVMVR